MSDFAVFHSEKYQTIEAKRRAISAINKTRQVKTIDNKKNAQYLDGTYFLCWINNDPAPTGRHWHPAVEVIMPIENGYSLLLSGETLELKEGDIVIIPPGTMHELADPRPGHRIIVLFDYSMMHQLFAITPTLFTTKIIAKNENSALYQTLKSLLESMINVYADHTPLWDVAFSSLVLQFLFFLNKLNLNAAADNSQMEATTQTKYAALFDHVFEYIDEHYTENLSLDDVADAVGYSKFHLSRIFKEYTNVSFTEYLTKRRIHSAVSLLTDHEMSITEAAMQSGFKSIATFNRAFKQEKECTPSEFRLLLS